MKKRGTNILPMTGFIMLVVLVLGGFALFGRKDENVTLNGETSSGKNAGSYNINETKETQVLGIKEIEIYTIDSDVIVKTHESEQVKAYFYGSITSLGKTSKPFLEVEQDGGRASVRIIYPKATRAIVRSDTKLEVTIPKNWGKDLTITSISGDITAEELIGNDISVKTTSGNIEAGRINADSMFKSSSVSGDCRIEQVKCEEGKLNSTSGNISIESVLAEKVTCKTASGYGKMTLADGKAEYESVSGNIDVVFTDQFDRFTAKSISGDIKLGIPDDSEFDIDIKTLSGDINCRSFLLNMATSKKDELKGRVGNGDSTVRINTTSGNIWVDSPSF